MPSTPIAWVGSGTFLAALDFEAWRHQLMSGAGGLWLIGNIHKMLGQILRGEPGSPVKWPVMLTTCKLEGLEVFCAEVQFPRKRCAMHHMDYLAYVSMLLKGSCIMFWPNLAALKMVVYRPNG